METSNKTGLFLALILSLVAITSQQATQDICDRPIDLIFVIDGSNSLGLKNFGIIKDTVSNAVEVLKFGVDFTHVGLVLYSTLVNAIIDIKDDKAAFKSEVLQLKYPDEETNTNLGIDKAVTMLTTARRPEIPSVMMVVTDGASTNRGITEYSAYVAASRGISIYGVGVADDADMVEMGIIANNKTNQTFHIANFTLLSDTLTNLTHEACITAETLPTFSIPTTTTPTPTTTETATTPTTTTTSATTLSSEPATGSTTPLSTEPATTVSTTPLSTEPATTGSTTPLSTEPATTGSTTPLSTEPPTGSTTPLTASTTAPSPGGNLVNGFDICKNSPSIGGVGYVLFPGDCSKVLQCYYNPLTNKTLVVTRQCPSGQFWDQSCLKCLDSWKVDCPYDKCKNERCNGTATSTLPMDGVCGGFWSCENGRSYPKCCPPCYSYLIGYGCKFGNTCFDRCGPDVGCTDGLGVCEKIPEWANVTNYVVATDSQGLSTTTCAQSNLNIVDCKCQTKFRDTFMQQYQECTPYYESTSSLPCSGAQQSYPIKRETDIGTLAIKIRINVNVPYFNITSAPSSAQGDNNADVKIWADDEGLHASVGDINNGGVQATILFKNLTGDVEILVMLHQGLFTLRVGQDKFQYVSTVSVKSKRICTDCIHNFSASSASGSCLVYKVQLYNCKPEVTTIYINS